jgi:hypothetical protein
MHRRIIDASRSFGREVGVLIKIIKKPVWVAIAKRIVISLTQVVSKRTRNPRRSFRIMSGEDRAQIKVRGRKGEDQGERLGRIR